MHQSPQPPGLDGSPSDAEVVALAFADLTFAAKLFERVDLVGEQFDVGIDVHRRAFCAGALCAGAVLRHTHRFSPRASSLVVGS
jgi:hypothetical protein